MNMNIITQINKNELVRVLPKIAFEKYKVCEACQMGKQIKTYFKNKNFISTSRSLELLHRDLFGPLITTSLRGKPNAFMIVYEFSKLCKKIQNEKGFTIFCIRSDHAREFENVDFESFCDKQAIEHNFQLLELPNKMGLLKGKIEPCKKWKDHVS